MPVKSRQFLMLQWNQILNILCFNFMNFVDKCTMKDYHIAE